MGKESHFLLKCDFPLTECRRLQPWSLGGPSRIVAIASQTQHDHTKAKARLLDLPRLLLSADLRELITMSYSSFSMFVKVQPLLTKESFLLIVQIERQFSGIIFFPREFTSVTT